ncbi:hypothetical protein GIB67_011529 [Kingdonia uniflora]|uniref:Uncharacterized protein n=1 Tax=Kingdonia uniflora TaxID=39325 RepID=A0A7J7NMC9_9MAGN|nr:hypothetical protein GIB67_011529 [Kingdonia uniflora]
MSTPRKVLVEVYYPTPRRRQSYLLHWQGTHGDMAYFGLGLHLYFQGDLGCWTCNSSCKNNNFIIIVFFSIIFDMFFSFFCISKNTFVITLPSFKLTCG